MEKWAKTGRTTVSSGKQTVVYLWKIWWLYLFHPTCLFFYSSRTAGIKMDHYLKLAQLQKRIIPQKILCTKKKWFLKIQPFKNTVLSYVYIGFLLWLDHVDFYSMIKGSCKLPLHLFPWEKQRDESGPLCSVELLGLNHYG